MSDDLTAARSQALESALRSLLQPLARLAVARGVPFAQVEGLLKQAFVQAAGDAHPDLLPHRKVSRISTATGINRREVSRLTQGAEAPPPPARSLASEVFAHWMSDRRYRHRDGRPRELPRQGPRPSFETLAQEVTRDVHPRSLLDELLRLRLAVFDPASDTVTLSRDAFVPSGDDVRMLGFLGDNVGDHLGAAVDNVLGSDRRHFEQSIFAGGLSQDTMAWIRQVIGAQWKQMLVALVPELEALIAADEAAAKNAPAARRRVRVGLYTYEAADPDSPAATPGAGAVPGAAPRARRQAPRSDPAASGPGRPAPPTPKAATLKSSGKPPAKRRKQT